MREFRIINGDALSVVGTLPSEGFDGCLCDPPYGLSFMGKTWDHGVPSPEVWGAILRVLKPGAMLMAFGGTRTFHRLTCAIEDAGFEIRDCMMWLYGSGFPKSLDIGKALDKRAGVERTEGGREWNGGKRSGGICKDAANEVTSTRVIYDTPATDAAKLWDGYGTALKPAWEPIILAMKPLDGTFAENALKHGVAGLHIAAGRISAQEGDDGVCRARKTGSTDTVGDFGFHRADSDAHNAPGTAGRWPANVLLDEEAAAILDEQSGQSCYPAHKTKRSATGKEEQYCGNFAGQSNVTVGHGDSGGASRFFYISKADSAERNASGPNNHPTIKPVDLCAYLAKLILPNRGDARLIVPFSGSGSEIMGALRAGWAECVGIEKESEYVDLSCRRITEDAPMFNVEIGDPLHRLTDAELAVLGAQDEAKKLALERDVE